MVTNGEPSCATGAINFPRFLRPIAPCKSIQPHQHPIHAGTVLYGWHNTNATSSEPEEELPTYPGVSNPFQTEVVRYVSVIEFKVEFHVPRHVSHMFFESA
ncbi:hypothetical protein RSAG8_06396, partial [Rhizoctonia solani AG-8 WAC10335]